jgi:mannose-6-phosphate isomerase-like protein (cupin superfamily)
MAKVRLHKLKLARTTEGELWSIFNNRDPDSESPADFELKQVYITTIEPGKSKGPIVHKERSSIIVPTQGRVIIQLGPDRDDFEQNPASCLLEIPPTMPFRFVNPTDKTVMLLVLANKAWSPDDDDSIKYDGWADYLQKTLKE